MKLPGIKKRISNFLVKEEGRISKQSLVSMGAFLGSSAISASLIAKEVFGETDGPCGAYVPTDPNPNGSQPPACTVCCGNPDNDDQGAGVCDNPGDREPGEGCPIDEDALTGENAYDVNGTQIYFGNGHCDDDDKIFHFNGTEFAYAEHYLGAEHHHHGSHNSY